MTSPLETAHPVSRRIGVGLATLMRAPRSRDRQRVLDAAYEVGVRHFDTAPLYGLGRAEPELGAFIRRTGASDLTVATKFGRTPGGLTRLVAPIQSPVRAAVKRSGVVRRRLKAVERSAGIPHQATPEEIAASVDRSLEALGVEAVDLLLLHEVHWNDSWTEAWDSVRTTIGARQVGISGSSALLSTYPDDVRKSVPVFQGPVDILEIAAGRKRIYHSAFSEFYPAFAAAALLDSASAAAMASAVEGRLTGRNLRRLALLSLLVEDPTTVVLVGTTNPDHLVDSVKGVAAASERVGSDERTSLLRTAAAARSMMQPSAHGRPAG